MTPLLWFNCVLHDTLPFCLITSYLKLLFVWSSVHPEGLRLFVWSPVNGSCFSLFGHVPPDRSYFFYHMLHDGFNFCFDQLLVTRNPRFCLITCYLELTLFIWSRVTWSFFDPDRFILPPNKDNPNRKCQESDSDTGSDVERRDVNRPNDDRQTHDNKNVGNYRGNLKKIT